jgi:hypothetical protein
MLKRTLTILLLLTTFTTLGQSTVQFIPELYGRNVDGLLKCTIINTSQKQTATLSITVSERKAGIICTVKTSEFSILPGSNAIPYATARGAAIQFSNSTNGRLNSLNRAFDQGDYEYCFTLNFTHSDVLPMEQCYNYTLAPFAELNLIDPYNKDKICDQRPLLTWQPLIPGIPGSFYQLVLSEIKTGQNATEALNYNLPVINQSNIVSPILPYPSIAPQLAKGKKYAWQVTAYKDQTVLNRSEIWEFTVDCQDSVKKVADDGYRDIEDLSKGNYYIAAGYLKFALVNPYQAQDLKYTITSLNEPDKKIKRLPKLKLKSGMNQTSIDLAVTGGFTDGSYYLLKVQLPNGATKSLRFLYTEAK